MESTHLIYPKTVEMPWANRKKNFFVELCNGCSLLSFILAKLLLLDIRCQNIFALPMVTALTACPISINKFAKMIAFYVKTAKIRWRLKLRPTLKKCFKFKAFILKTHTAGNKLRTGPLPGGCRSLIYNNVVSRYFSKMLFAEKPEKFFAFALLSLLKKSYRNIE